MKEFKILKFIDKFSRFFEKSGIDYKIMRKILQLKLTTDERRIPTIMSNKTDEGKNNYNSSLLLYGFMGIFIGIMIVIPAPLFLKMNIVFGMLIFMTMSTMISDFSTVLLDMNDKNILMPRPIKGKTINAAKIIHIAIYLSKLTLAISAGTIIIGTVRYGVVFLVLFLLELTLVAGFVIFFTSILYFLVLKFFDGEKLKDMINYFQILLSIVMMVVYQLIGHVFQLVNVKATFTLKWWTFLLPSSWFAAPFSVLLEANNTKGYYLMSVLCILIPLLAFILYFKFISTYFEKNLQKLNNNSKKKGRSIANKMKWNKKVADILCRDKEERIFYRFTQNMISSERKLKLTIYPTLAFAVVMPFVFLVNIFTSAKSISEAISDISKGYYYLFMYITIMMLSLVVISINRSEKFKGAWVYRVLPIKSPTPIYKGAYKGMFVKIILPIYLVVALIFLVFCGPKIIFDLILIFLNLIATTLIVLKLVAKELPFSRDFTFKQENNIGVVFGSVAMVMGVTLMHIVVKFIPLGVFANIIVSALFILLIWKTSFKLTWQKLFS
ncbi:MAG: ABC transporter permease [Clostridiaceae bacterium]|nr:ABC transporter permease [Clostridiaceae bacterium]